jgi:restriction system protein
MHFLTDLILSAIIMLIGYGAVTLWKYRKKMSITRALFVELLMTNTEMQKTMTMGLYYRFKKDDETDEKKKEEKLSKIFLREDPLLFEDFVAKVLCDYYGGSYFVTQKSGDYGVDIEHK